MFEYENFFSVIFLEKLILGSIVSTETKWVMIKRSLTKTVDIFSLNVIDMTDNMATCEHAEPIAVTMRIMNAKAIKVDPLGISPRNLNNRKKCLSSCIESCNALLPVMWLLRYLLYILQKIIASNSFVFCLWNTSNYFSKTLICSASSRYAGYLIKCTNLPWISTSWRLQLWLKTLL